MIRIINLETDIEKRQNITSQFNKYDINYEFRTGIDGLKYKLSTNDLEYLKDVDYNIHTKKGVVGCHLAHIKLLEELCNSEEEYFIVGEDDIIIIEPEIKTIINDLLTKINLNDYSIIYLCSGKTKPDTQHIVSLNDTYNLYDCKNRWFDQGNLLYLITKHGARDLLNKYYNYKCKRAIDMFYIDQSNNPTILYPSLVKHKGDDSSIDVRGGH
jgi:GR25 family glycosyltransferase involved in LPS biosynthesis